MTTIATFDGVNKVINITATGAILTESLYSRWLDWACDPVNAGYSRPFDDGNLLTTIDQHGSISTSVRFTIINGWTVTSNNGVNIIGGELIAEDGSNPLLPQNGQVVIVYHSTAVVTQAGASAAELLAAMNAAPPKVNVAQMNGHTVQGSGVASDLWRG